MFHWMRWLGLSAALGVGCGPTLPTPSIESVSPAWGYNGEPTPVVIEGNNLLPRVRVTGAVPDGVDQQWRGWVLTDPRVELTGVDPVSFEEIHAAVPPGIQPGVYGIELESPNKVTATLADAFQVTDTRADHLLLDSGGISWPVNQVAILRISLRDPVGGLVPGPLEVALTVEGNNSESEDYVLEAGGLENPIFSPDGLGLNGDLGNSGEAFVGFSSQVPDDIWIRVAAVGNGAIDSASQLLSFRAGRVAGIEISVDEADLQPLAGSYFPATIQLVDELGNPVEGEHGAVALVEACPGGTLNEVVTFVDQTTVELSLTAAVSEACPENAILAFGVAEGSSVEGRSPPILVQPGPTALLDVYATPAEIQAGADLLTLVIKGADPWLNPTTEPLEGVAILDEAGVLEEANGNGQHSCELLSDGEAICTATVFGAGLERRLFAAIGESILGTSNPLVVHPGPADHLDVTSLASVVVAGDPFVVGIQVLDAFDNPYPMSAEALSSIQVFDIAGPVSCALVASDDTAALYSHQCICTVAQEITQLNVIASAVGATGLSNSFAVVPGPLDQVNVSLVAPVTAGTSVLLSLAGVDAYGNPVQDSESLDLSDVSGPIVPPDVTLVAGTAALMVTMDTARVGNTISVLRADRLVGISDPFSLVAAAASGLHIRLDSPWVWTDAAVPVTVWLGDSFGNPVDAESITVTLASSGGLAADVVGTVTGPTVFSLDYGLAGIGETITASSGPWVGESVAFHVVDRCPGAPPLSVAVGGAVDEAICLGGDGSATASIDAGRAGLAHYRYVVFGQVVADTGNFSIGHTWSGAGHGQVRVLGIDSTGCGVEDSVALAVGHVGDVVGAVSVIPARETLISGTTGGDEATDVSVSGHQCTGDLAGGSTVLVRATLGDLTAAGGYLLGPSGGGIELTLGSDGEGILNWTMVDAAVDGEARILAGTNDGGAWGSAEVNVEGDSLPPTVLAQDPVGTTSGGFEAVGVDFSEAMLTSLASVVLEDSVMLHAPDGAVVEFESATWVDGGRRLEVDYSDPMDASDGVWFVSISDDLRDVAGNRLDGDVDGVAGGAHAAGFGAVPLLPPDVVGCQPSTSTIRPDGDAGDGWEADRIQIEIETDIGAEWWWLDVIDEAGILVHRERFRRTGLSMGTLEWNGRNLGAMVVENGVYLLDVVASDEYWNMGVGCQVAVRVDNRLGVE